MISVPGMKSAGKQSESLVETIDLFPTLIELCQPSFKKTQKRLDGKSLVPIIENPLTEVKDASFSFWRNSVSVRTQRFRLIANIADKKLGKLDNIELYSSEQEFDPVKNLADQHPTVVRWFVEKFKSELLRAEH